MLKELLKGAAFGTAAVLCTKCAIEAIGEIFAEPVADALETIADAAEDSAIFFETVEEEAADVLDEIPVL